MSSTTSTGLKLVRHQRRFFSAQQRHFLARQWHCNTLHCRSSQRQEIVKSHLLEYPRTAKSALKIIGGGLRPSAVLQWRFFGAESIGENDNNNDKHKQEQSLADRTEILCDLKVHPRGSFTPELLQEGAEILRWWTGMASYESIRYSFRLLKRLLEEDAEGKIVKDDDVFLLNSVIRNWSDSTDKDFSAQPQTVVNLLLLKDKKLVSKQASTYAILLKEATKDDGRPVPTRDNEVRSLWTYIEELCGDDNEELKSEIDACAKNILIQMWARDGRVIKTINMTKSYLESKEMNESGNFKLVDETFMSILVLFLLNSGSKFDREIEDFLRWTAQHYEKDCIEVKPNSLELLSWTLFQCPSGCEIEELILNETEWLGKKIGNGLRNDFETYRDALHVWAKAGDTVRAEAILDQMFNLAGKGSTALQPDLECCNTVLRCLSRSNGENAGVKATALLTKMRETEDIRPNYLSYYTVVQCWANSNHPDAIENIEEILSTMENDSKESNSQRCPGRFLYCSAISVFKKSEEHEMIASTLERMADQCRKGNLAARPLADDFKTALSSLHQSKPHDAWEKGLVFVELMEELRKEGILDTKLNPILMNYLLFLKLWQPSGQPVTEQKAKEIIEYVEEMSRSPDSNIKGSELFYDALILFWAMLGDTETSEALLKRMYAEFLEEPGEARQPIVTHFNHILLAWSYSGAPRAARRADAIVEHMKKLHGTRLNSCKPNATTYFHLQQCWKKSGLPEASERLASIQKEKTK